MIALHFQSLVESCAVEEVKLLCCDSRRSRTLALLLESIWLFFIECGPTEGNDESNCVLFGGYLSSAVGFPPFRIAMRIEHRERKPELPDANCTVFFLKNNPLWSKICQISKTINIV